MKKGRRREREVGRRKTSQCSVQNGKVKGVSACLPTTIPPLITSASSSGVVDCADWRGLCACTSTCKYQLFFFYKKRKLYFVL